MSNLTNNTASLEALLNKANALPDKSDGIDTSDATITPDTVFLNETGYANGQKVTGTFTIEDEVSEQENLIAQIASALEGKAAGGGSVENIEVVDVTIYVENNLPIDAQYTGKTTNDTIVFLSWNSESYHTNYHTCHVVKETMFTVLSEDNTLNYTTSGEVYDYLVADNFIVFEIYGDGTITIS